MARKKNIFQKVLSGLKTIYKRSKVAIISALAVAGTILMVTSIQAVLPNTFNLIYTFIIGLGLVLFAGYLSRNYVREKRRRR